jgi:enoyl-CoA hydratase/carnithine racemase
MASTPKDKPAALQTAVEDTVLKEVVPIADRDGDVAVILCLNRPEALNAMTWQMIRELEAHLKEAGADPRTRAILITGRGRAFSAGGDLKAYLDLQLDADAFPRFVDDLMRTFQGIRTISVPVIALINGVTAAGGLELLLSCDFAWAAESAEIGDGHLNYGQMGGGGVLSLLPRSIPPALARELLFSGRLLPAAEAREWGLVNRVLPDGELMPAALAFVAELAGKSRTAVTNAKYVMNAGLVDGVGEAAAMKLERERNALYCLTSPDAREGLAAFGERRAPNYRGE